MIGGNVYLEHIQNLLATEKAHLETVEYFISRGN